MSQLFDAARESFLNGEINLSGDTIVARLVPASYSPDLETDQFADSVATWASTGVTLTSKTTDAPAPGVFDAANVTFASVAAGDPIGGVVIYKSTGSLATSRLIAYIDDASGFPFTPDGTNVTVEWDSGDSRIFRL